MNDDLKSLGFALQKYPDQVEAFSVDRLVLDSARQNQKRAAYLKLAVPDDVVKTLRGDKDARDLVLIVRVPREIVDREESRIVLPNEVG
jgi:hypothetical protein